MEISVPTIPIALVIYAGDVVVIIVTLLVALFFFFRVRSGKLTDVAKEIAIGVIWVNLGVVLNVARLAVERYYDWQNTPGHHWINSAVYLVLPPLLIVIYGYGLHLAPILKAVLGAHYILKYTILCMVVYIVVLLSYWVLR